jgi:dihydrofolate reductase
MAKLIYAAITSLDLYVADGNGNFDWAEPDEDVHTFVNDLERPIGTHLYGRRMYDVLKVWESDEWMVDAPGHIVDYAAIWRAADKIVYSRSLAEVSTARTRIERNFDPEAVRRLKETSEHDLGIGGPNLAAEALRAGLVDEIHLFLNPIIVGGGNAALPDGVRLQLELVEERRLGSGVVYLRYQAAA